MIRTEGGGGYEGSCSRARFSWINIFSSIETFLLRDRVFDVIRIFVRQSWTQPRREGRSSMGMADGWIIVRSRSRPRIGARERKDKKISLMMI